MEPAIKASSSVPYIDNTMNAQSSCNPSSVLITWQNTQNTYVFNYDCILDECFYVATNGYPLSRPDICGNDPECTVFLQANSADYTTATCYTAVTCEDVGTTYCSSYYQDSWNVRTRA